MKRIKHLTMLLAAMLLSACSSNNEPKAETTGQQRDLGSTLVVYYSFSGDCSNIVGTLTQLITADVARVEPAQDGVDYAANNYKAGADLINAINAAPNDAGSYPSIKNVDKDVNGYDHVIIVTPLWHSHMAAPMQAYLFQNAAKLAGKQVAMIVSSYSSSIGGVVSDATRLLPDATFTTDALWINNSNRSRTASLLNQWLDNINFTQSSMNNEKITVTVGDRKFIATLKQNATAQAFRNMLPLTLPMSELNGNEKYYYLDSSLPTQASSPGTIHAGDIMLYGASCVVLFYDTFSTSYSYTPIGHIDNPAGLREALGTGGVTVAFERISTGIDRVAADTQACSDSATYAIDGRRVAVPGHGIYIQNGKKIVR